MAFFFFFFFEKTVFTTVNVGCHGLKWGPAGGTVAWWGYSPGGQSLVELIAVHCVIHASRKWERGGVIPQSNPRGGVSAWVCTAFVLCAPGGGGGVSDGFR